MLYYSYYSFTNLEIILSPTTALFFIAGKN